MEKMIKIVLILIAVGSICFFLYHFTKIELFVTDFQRNSRVTFTIFFVGVNGCLIFNFIIHLVICFKRNLV